VSQKKLGLLACGLSEWHLLPKPYTLHPHRMERDRSCQLDIMVFSERVSNASVAMLFPVGSAICGVQPYVALGPVSSVAEAASPPAAHIPEDAGAVWSKLARPTEQVQATQPGF
jgi:hypothetical protein